MQKLYEIKLIYRGRITIKLLNGLQVLGISSHHHVTQLLLIHPLRRSATRKWVTFSPLWTPLKTNTAHNWDLQSCVKRKVASFSPDLLALCEQKSYWPGKTNIYAAILQTFTFHCFGIFLFFSLPLHALKAEDEDFFFFWDNLSSVQFSFQFI